MSSTTTLFVHTLLHGLLTSPNHFFSIPLLPIQSIILQQQLFDDGNALLGNSSANLPTAVLDLRYSGRV
jgi:hypothetical protein